MIIKPEVFQDGFVPRRILHRDAEVEQLSRAFQPALMGERPLDVLLTGPSGVGKTVLARHTINRLRDQTAVDRTYIRCLGLTARDILRTALRKHPDGPSVFHENDTIQDLRHELRDTVDAPYILVLDEADGLPDTSALDHLDRVPEISTVIICHDAEDWQSRLTNSTNSYRSDDVVRLNRYAVDELADILEIRVREGLSGTVPRRRLEHIADTVAGVARDGIQTLKAAIQRAQEQGRSELTEGDVEAGYERARGRIRKENLFSLPFHHHLLYAIIHAAGEIRAGELHGRYDETAEKYYHGRDLVPISRRSRRSKLKKLKRYDLISWDGESRHRHYWVQDETIAPPIKIELTSP
ncbi:Cdc6/Cdc18 family protein [Halostella sp. PRR32]|uniref:Cdc6/Cdc18 family protein n=1 Tax=Halostella sp. PRR32 TaxID=3098147 RepID=UPI002B1E8613|nr:Cdc6/Cdc18 family protein [Halostella sp. PRR32]